MFRKVMDLVSGSMSSPEKEDENEEIKVGTSPTSWKTTAKEDNPDDKLLKQQQQYNEDEDNVMNDTKTPAQEEEEEDSSVVVSKMMILPTSKNSKETLVHHPSVSLMMEPELASTRSSNVDVDDDSSTTSGIPRDMPRSSSEPKSTSNAKAKSRTTTALGKRKAPAGRIRGRGIIKIRDGTTFRLSDGYRGTPLQTTTPQISSLPFLKRSLIPLLQDDNNSNNLNPNQQQFMLATVLTREGFCQTVASNDRCCPLCNFDAKTDHGLLSHCRRVHSDEYRVDSVRDDDGMLHFYARSHNSCSTRNSTDPRMFGSIDRVFQRKRSSSSHKRKQQPRNHPPSRPPRTNPSDDRPTSRSIRRRTTRMSPITQTFKLPVYSTTRLAPMHQYVHSRSRQPIDPHRFDQEGADESSTSSEDEEWRSDYARGALEEFLDVSSDDRQFFFHWNEFVRSVSVGSSSIADHQMPHMCFDFIRTHVDTLQGQRTPLEKHLLRLHEESLISRDHIRDAMKEFDSLQQGKRS